jgi:hypothetical protein
LQVIAALPFASLSRGKEDSTSGRQGAQGSRGASLKPLQSSSHHRRCRHRPCLPWREPPHRLPSLVSTSFSSTKCWARHPLASWILPRPCTMLQRPLTSNPTKSPACAPRASDDGQLAVIFAPFFPCGIPGRPPEHDMTWGATCKRLDRQPPLIRQPQRNGHCPAGSREMRWRGPAADSPPASRAGCCSPLQKIGNENGLLLGFKMVKSIGEGGSLGAHFCFL